MKRIGARGGLGRHEGVESRVGSGHGEHRQGADEVGARAKQGVETRQGGVGGVQLKRAEAGQESKPLSCVVAAIARFRVKEEELEGCKDEETAQDLVVSGCPGKACGHAGVERPEDCAGGRRQALQIVAAMREFGGEALATTELITTGPQIGVRETRRVKGLYVLTEEDAKVGRRFDDVIAWRSGWLDIGFVRFEAMKIHQVPYRAIVPEKVDGLLVAGRCISTTHAAASAGKSMGNCMATGHAAGLAAVLSIRSGCQPRELSVPRLQEALRRDGVDLTRGGEDQDPHMSA